MQESLFHIHHDLEERHWWFRARRRSILELGASLLPAGGRVVDVGCGTGADIAAFPASYDRHGLDASETAIRFARERHGDIRFDVAAFPDGGVEVVASADLVLLCDVLEHIEDHEGFFRSLISTMKPGAHLLTTVPADPRLWSPHDEVYGHYRRYTRAALAGVWEGLPAEVRLLAPFNRILYPAVRVARMLASRRGRSWGRGEGDLRLPWSPVNRLMEWVFAREIPPLRAALEGRRNAIRGRGVSLLAVLRREQPGR